MLYTGRVWLRYTEAEFWELTPRKFKSQLDVHMELIKAQSSASSRSNSGVTDGYIDQIPGW